MTLNQKLNLLYHQTNGSKGILFYVAFVFLVTFIVFPGVTNNTTLNFIDKDGKWF
jgi:hypothetical protein